MDSFRFFSSSLSSPADNLSEGLHNYKCTNCNYCINYISTKDSPWIFKCVDCSKNYKKYFNKDLIKRFKNTYELWYKNIAKCILLLNKICMFRLIYYHLQMYLKIIEIKVLKIWTWSCSFSISTLTSMVSLFKKNKSKIITINR